MDAKSDISAQLFPPVYVCFLMVFNGISFGIILTCYLAMYVSIRDSPAWNSRDTRVAKRMALLVFTGNRGGKFGIKEGQIAPKWDKFRDFVRSDFCTF